MTARLKKASRCFFLLRLADLAAMGLMQIEKGRQMWGNACEICVFWVNSQKIGVIEKLQK